MSDISKFIGVSDSADLDKEGRRRELEGWDRDTGMQRAGELGITMTDDHWKAVEFLRESYIEHGPKPARRISDELEKQFELKGGGKYLYTLFPGGPVTQGCQIAGIPVPADSTSSSFGSSF